MTAAPLISVLLPVYDGAATLPACLDSVLGQSETDFELVAADDGSADATPALLAARAAADPRVRPLRLPHRGIVAALNAGLAACRGRYVARIDADDRMHPHRLARQRAFLEAHPACDLAGSLVEGFRLEGPLPPGVRRHEAWLNGMVDDAAIRRGLFIDAPIAHPTFFARRAFYARLGGYRDAPWAEDYDFLLRAAAAGARFGKVPEVLVYRGDSPGRVTRTDPRCHRAAMFRAKAHYLRRDPRLAERGAVIAGTGPTGRLAGKALREAGAAVLAFTDNSPGPPGRTVQGVPAHGFPEGTPDAFLEGWRHAHLVVCIGEPPARARFLAQLERLGFREGRDFTRFV